MLNHNFFAGALWLVYFVKIDDITVDQTNHELFVINDIDVCNT